MERPTPSEIAFLFAAFAAHATPAQAASFKVLYSFAGGSAGATPLADLLVVGQKLYGTTSSGGSGNNGTVFSLSLKTGTAKVLHAFTGGSDGNGPAAGLTKIGTKLFGTTVGGGEASEGTVFSLDIRSGAESVVYAFSGGSDGANPQSKLVEDGGLLYGTATGGGGGSCSFGCGTVFSIDPVTGAEKTIYIFQGGADGAFPNAGLIKVGHTLRGTTVSGGAGDAGTVFNINLVTGAENVVHNFDMEGDGTNPVSSLIDVSGTLYGATIAGGVGGDGLGTIYAIDRKTNAEHVVYEFAGGSDGALPEGGVIEVGDTLYGTTSLGGKPNAGVVFSLDPATGVEKILHTFRGSDGANPWASLTKAGANLYGTTYGGGSVGAGVVFTITP